MRTSDDSSLIIDLARRWCDDNLTRHASATTLCVPIAATRRCVVHTTAWHLESPRPPQLSGDHVRVILTRVGRRAALCAAGASVAVIAACSDDVSGPKAPHVRALTPGSRASATVESPASLTIPLTISDTNGKGDSRSFTSPVFTFTTVMKAVAEGNVTRTPNYSGIAGPTTYGPVGNTAMAWLDGLNVGNGAGFSDSATTYVRFANGSHGLSASATNYGAESEQNFGPDHITCGPQYAAPLCATFSGSRSITLTRLESSLNLIADSTNVAPGSVVRFTATANPAVVDGQTIPVEVDSSSWTPDGRPYGEPNDTVSSCGFGARGYTCTRLIVGSGTFHVVAYVNGKRQEGSVHITTPALTLNATPRSVKKGDSVTFAPVWSDGHSADPEVWSWTWTPDVPPAQTPGCGWWEHPCRKPVQESGMMKVQVRRNGVDRYATVHVYVLPCLTADSILDNTPIRQAMKVLIAASGPELPPGDGIANGDSVGNKREHAGWIFRTVTGEYYFEEDTAVQSNALANECYVKETNSTLHRHQSSDVVVAHVHTHPTHKYKAVYGCPPNANGPDSVLTQRGPWDTGRPKATKRPDIETGGGSIWGDWTVVWQTRDEYVVNADGEVWHLPSYLQWSQQASNRLLYKYKGNSNSSCDW